MSKAPLLGKGRRRGTRSRCGGGEPSGAWVRPGPLGGPVSSLGAETRGPGAAPPSLHLGLRA